MLSMHFNYARVMTTHGFQVILLAVWSCWVLYMYADLHIHALPELYACLNSNMSVNMRDN